MHAMDDTFNVISGTHLHPGLMSFERALQHTLERVPELGREQIPLVEAVGRVLADSRYALVDSPSVDCSQKDGYALHSTDVTAASPGQPARLRIIGSAAAGSEFRGRVNPGHAVRILSGARIPLGADAVLSEEFADEEGDFVIASNDAEPGRNIQRCGSDIHRGQLLLERGAILSPAHLGLLAAAGHLMVPVMRRPGVAIISTGDEVVAPGQKLREGQLFASNLVALAGWCTHYGMSITVHVVQDERAAIERHLRQASEAHDAILTSGGAWSGERDLVVRILDALGWDKVYHRVRIGPGKAVGFGLLNGKPVFCLPGGPPSNQMAFMQLALPGLLKLGGHARPGLPKKRVILGESVRAQEGWTQFVDGRLEEEGGVTIFHPYRMTSRLQSMVTSQSILKIPEHVALLPKGSSVRVQVLPYTCIDEEE